MLRNLFRLMVMAHVVTAAGCSMLRAGGSAVNIDWDKWGTGEQAITPRNDNQYVDGQMTNTSKPK